MNVRLYLGFLSKSFKQRAAYRLDLLLYSLGTVIQLIVQVSLWHALTGSGRDVAGASYSDMVTFVLINMIVSSLVSSDIGETLTAKISEGTIVIDLIRPAKLKYYLIFDNLGRNIYRAIFGSIPISIFAILFLRPTPPADTLRLLLFTVAVLNGIMLMSLMSYLFGLVGFWLQTTWYVSWFLAAFFRLFGGTMVPIWFYPESLATVAKFLPFRLVTYEPIQIFLGRVSAQATLRVLLLQIGWIVLLTCLEKLVWARAERKIVVHGG